jgi:brefeldin A-inhibited guanine nucleotide-exchange protein
VNYSHEHAQECVGVMNQLLDIVEEEEDEDISSVQSINKLAMAFAHLLSTWSSYSNIILVRHNANNPENISTSISTSPPISSHLLAMAVDAAQSLVAHGCLDVLQTAATATVINEHHHQEDDDAIHRISNAVCKMDLSTEECETSALKFLLTTACRISTTTNGSMLHGKSLLQLIRTAYHIYLKTGSETSKTTARAALQQMVASVFQRMEHVKNNDFIQDKTKETAALTSPAASGNEALQKFFANHPEVYSPRKEDNKDDKKDVAISTEVMYANVYKLLNFQSSTSLLLQRDQYLPFKKKADDSAKVLESAFVEETATNTSGDKATTVATASFASLAHLDAFLVLRSLCKLSMKTLPEGGGGGASPHAIALNMTSVSPVTEEVSGLDYDGSDRVVATAHFQPHASSTFTANPLVVHPAMESKILALELLLYVMDHAASPQELFSTPSFSFAIRHYLCVSLLKNCTSNNTRIVALSLRLFLPIIRNFREGLKPEIEAFVTNVFFVILESRNSTVEHKILVLTMFKEICSCEDTLAEIFLNYDCDLSAVDLFHRIVTALAKQGGNESSISNHSSIYNDGLINSLYSSSRNARNMALRQSHRELKLNAMTALRQVLASLYATVKVGNNTINSNSIDATSCLSGNSGHSSSAATRCFDNTSTNNKSSSTNNLLTPVEQANGSVAASAASSVPSSNIVKMYDSKRKRREQEAEIYIRFNQDPKAGLKYAGECGLLDIASPDEVAKFFLKNKDKLDKTQIGDYLGREPEYQNGFCVRVLHTYVDMIDLKGLSFDDAIRFFLSGFRLPGEAQKVSMSYCFKNRYTHYLVGIPTDVKFFCITV